MLPPVAGAFVRPVQLFRNAVHSGSRRRFTASGRRPGRSGLLVCCFALPQTVGLSAALAGSQFHYESRVEVE
jgi:hypothetical protein